ncbi:DUF7504 family protein [Halorussus lipolyticus]|uniref:DUF7504 family protein n=1 Tax=Halorussus lipolyticus TaxID=3034024 RepID=UPI0023E802E6|nr:hypothetical protein [Halorussus sp. DT80]
MSDGGSRNERGTDSPGEDIVAFQSRLRRLKREGCNLLVVGDVPRELFTRASESMVGDADARRWRVFGLTDATPESVRDRIPPDDVAPRPRSETTKLVSHSVGSQRTADTAPTAATADTVFTPGTGTNDARHETTPTPPAVDVSDGDLTAFRRELVSAVEEFGARSHRPAEVRLAIDSLGPLFDHYDLEAIREFLRAVGDRVHARNAMAHYVLPVAYDSDPRRVLADEFDAIVELRTTTERPGDCAAGDDSSADDSPRLHRPEERWHLPDSDVTMPWVSL